MLAFTVTFLQGALTVSVAGPELSAPHAQLFIAVGAPPSMGAAVLPFGQGQEGSTVFLPFRADRLFALKLEGAGSRLSQRVWSKFRWNETTDAYGAMRTALEPPQWTLTLGPDALPTSARPALAVAAYVKDMAGDDGWGWMLPAPQVTAGRGEKVLRTFWEINRDTGATAQRTRRRDAERVRIYQVFPRLFGNTHTPQKPHGSLQENGVGKFADLSDVALRELRKMHFTHLWLTGVLRQATATDYSAIGLPADDPDLLKGMAGSPYAIKDLFDVCPDYALDPAKRLEEFTALLARVHAAGLRALIDFVPNHVARSYASTVRPASNLGAHDDHSLSFSAQNHFFYLGPNAPGGGPPLRLPTVVDGSYLSPTCAVLGAGDGLYEGELNFGRVTGNNAATWRPSRHDWYETVKLNYGYDFLTGQRAYPHFGSPSLPLPDTWLRMDEVIAYWQELGVDGFRCDMAHLVPAEFWSFLIEGARQRRPEVYFLGEGYNNDPLKVPSADPLLTAVNGGVGHVLLDLLNAGFDAVYDDPSYKALKKVCEGPGWANDMEGALGHEFLVENALNYAENHDEVRLAGRGQWGGAGMRIGPPLCALLFGRFGGPVLIYNGQEVGEPAAGAAGYAGDNGRTTIFDYWNMPELARWLNDGRCDGGQLSDAQRALREFYAEWLGLLGEPGFADGTCFALNAANVSNERYGRIPGEPASGHWLFSYLRYDAASGQRFLVLANLHQSRSFEHVLVRLPPEAWTFLDVSEGAELRLEIRLAEPSGATDAQCSREGFEFTSVAPLSAFCFELLLSGLDPS